MADTPVTPVKITAALTDPNTYKKWVVYVGITLAAILLISLGFKLWNFIFPKSDKQVNNPRTTVYPFGKIEKGGVDQSNTQVLVDEKPWEAGAGVGGFRYDNKDGYGIMLWLKRKW